MFIFVPLLVIVGSIYHGFGFDEYSPSQVAKTTCYGKGSLVPASTWPFGFEPSTAEEDPPSYFQLITRGTHSSLRLSKWQLNKWRAMPGIAPVGAFAGRNTTIAQIASVTGLQVSRTRTSPRHHAPHMRARQIGEPVNKIVVEAHNMANSHGVAVTPGVQVPGGKANMGKGKGKHAQSPFDPAQSAPWPTTELNALPSPFAHQAPVAPSSSAVADSEDVELLMAVKDTYPDLSKAPTRIQAAVAKAQKTSAKHLTTGLNKTSKAVGTASKELQNLRDARAQHRERWLKHLKDSVSSWGAAIEALYRSAKQLQRADQEGQARTGWCKINTRSAQPKSSRQPCPWHRSPRPRWGGDRKPAAGRCRSSCSGNPSSNCSPSLCQGRYEGRPCDGDLRRRRAASRTDQATTLTRALWRCATWWSCFVSRGSDTLCLKESRFREPSNGGVVREFWC